MAKEVLYFMLPNCPHCRLAEKYVKQLMDEEPRYRGVSIRAVDESAHLDYANTFDYYFVPTYYVDGVKVHEGHAEKADVRKVLEAAVK